MAVAASVSMSVEEKKNKDMTEKGEEGEKSEELKLSEVTKSRRS